MNRKKKKRREKFRIEESVGGKERNDSLKKENKTKRNIYVKQNVSMANRLTFANFN